MTRPTLCHGKWAPRPAAAPAVRSTGGCEPFGRRGRRVPVEQWHGPIAPAGASSSPAYRKRFSIHRATGGPHDLRSTYEGPRRDDPRGNRQASRPSRRVPARRHAGRRRAASNVAFVHSGGEVPIDVPLKVKADPTRGTRRPGPAYALAPRDPGAQNETGARRSRREFRRAGIYGRHGPPQREDGARKLRRLHQTRPRRRRTADAGRRKLKYDNTLYGIRHRSDGSMVVTDSGAHS